VKTPGRGNATAAARLVPLALALVVCVSAIGCTTVSVRRAMNQGVGFYKSKEFEKAAESFKRAISLDKSYAEAHLNLGLTYMELYEPGSEHPKDKEYAEGAIESFKSYIRLEPESLKARDYLINICKLANRMPDAIGFIMEDYAKRPQDVILVKTIATLFHMSGDTEKAIEWFEKVAQLEPNNPEAHYSVGVACWGRSYNSMNLEYEARMQLLDKGLSHLEKASALRADYYEAYSYTSLTYREKSKYDISPATSVMWRQKADETLAKAMELRNKALAAQAAAAAVQQGDKPSPTGSTSAPAPGR
jgi:tetratricopeptide (TPR) repeat protein